jgi:hypothetical protein
MFSRINLLDSLKKERTNEEVLFEEVVDLLENSALKEEDILKRLKDSGNEILSISDLDEKEKNDVFTLPEIKKVCVKYRLRFLDSKHFTAEFPYEAILKIKAFEQKYKVKIDNFKIIAPDEVFKLQDINKDPLLFAQLANNKYLLIHQWGKDLAWYRAIKYYPVRSIYAYFNAVWLLAIAIALAIPFDWMKISPEYEIGMRLWLSLHSFIALFFFILFLGSTGRKTFSEDNWNSKYFNQ